MPKTRTSSKKVKLEEASLESVVKYIQDHEVKHVIVMTGAGISTAAGIPDFRSKGTGLYSNLQRFNLPYAEAVFDIDYFEENPQPFYTLAKELYPGRFLPTKTHYFVRLLQEKGILLRNFTQNIDTLERLAGLDEALLVEAHGSFATASCVTCKKKADSDKVKKKALAAQVPHCEECDGLIKPDIVFFGEGLPKRFFDLLDDFEKADLLIVIGTSLQVQPFASLIDNVPDHIPRLLINREEAGVHHTKSMGFDFKWKYGSKRDVAHLGDCDESIEKLCELLGWRKDLDQLYHKGHEKLKAIWKQEEENEEEEEVVEQRQDKDVDQLAEVLENLTTEENKNKIK
ncbi:NAD-dependent protein deacetylase sirtuin-2 [Rhizopus stolonifer]|uniref:NAD-dependent protein deacetylase n=1 Tax=Rhizopus stolonifer TaxID=4846 RepID=A0A367JHU5_RHIST|nr:NAD-dependent protein deacetylase sirtuin-2 [Rhizopus stolonifer]